ncbi:hypothetical protein IWZ03DRAFT_368074 [Phyllosticta citriasiana]|uniref:Secreted protein n=1 Tax=Phyllosticta citriasiana TaxID=595635 RepID=A0ABR1L3D1_9PEZI
MYVCMYGTWWWWWWCWWRREAGSVASNEEAKEIEKEKEMLAPSVFHGTEPCMHGCMHCRRFPFPSRQVGRQARRQAN